MNLSAEPSQFANVPFGTAAVAANLASSRVDAMAHGMNVSFSGFIIYSRS